MRVAIYDEGEDLVEAFDNWNMPLPLVGDKVLDTKTNMWLVVYRVFKANTNTVLLYCELQ